jgi:hypothetical protein
MAESGGNPGGGGMREIATEVLVRDFLLYVCLPLWVIFGFADYLCHRASSIETTTSVRESLLHAIMGIQVGLAIFLGLFFKINVLMLLLILAVLVFHEVVAHWDVKLARDARRISMAEAHAHSFLEVIPFVIVALVVLLHWPDFLDLITLHWAGSLTLTTRPPPGGAGYIPAYFGLMMALGIVPYAEEMWRCWRCGKAATR